LTSRSFPEIASSVFICLYKAAFSLVEKMDQSECGQTDQQFPFCILILSGLRIKIDDRRIIAPTQIKDDDMLNIYYLPFHLIKDTHTYLYHIVVIYRVVEK
jgi:hypothetical protein